MVVQVLSVASQSHANVRPRHRLDGDLSTFRDPAPTTRGDGFDRVSSHDVGEGEAKTGVGDKPPEMELAGLVVEVHDEKCDTPSV